MDAGLLSILTYPAFAVTDQNLVDTTKQAIVDKLQVGVTTHACNSSVFSFHISRTARRKYTTFFKDFSIIYM